MRAQRVAGSLLRQLLRTTPAAAEAQGAAAVAAAATAGGSSLRAFSSAPPGPSVPPAVTYVDISEEWYNRQRQTIPLGNRVPETAASVYLSPSATIVGDVDLLDRVSRQSHCPHSFGAGGAVNFGCIRGQGCVGVGSGGRNVSRRKTRIAARRCAAALPLRHCDAAVVAAHHPSAAPSTPVPAPSLSLHPCRHHHHSPQASVWNHAVLRGDLNNITVGQLSNIQDRTVIHAARCAAATTTESGEREEKWASRSRT